MKAIISHDIDHITATEHIFRDLILPKYFIRTYIEFFTRKISLNELYNRHKDIIKNKLQNIEELHKFNIEKNVKATFFIGVKNGLGLSYPLSKSILWINKLLSMNVSIGIHCIEYETYSKINEEYKKFENLSNLKSFGTRMHYIRKNDTTYQNMQSSGYIYDTTEFSFRKPYKIGNMWEFPFQIMDSYIIEKPKQWQSKNLQQACEVTKILIEKAKKEKLPYLIIDFHDRYFSDSHKTWKNWYIWLINYLIDQNIEFVDFHKAIQELEKNNELSID